MRRVCIDVSDGDLEILKEEAGKRMLDYEEYLSEFVSEQLRPFRAKRFKERQNGRSDRERN